MTSINAISGNCCASSIWLHGAMKWKLTWPYHQRCTQEPRDPLHGSGVAPRNIVANLLEQNSHTLVTSREVYNVISKERRRDFKVSARSRLLLRKLIGIPRANSGNFRICRPTVLRVLRVINRGINLHYEPELSKYPILSEGYGFQKGIRSSVTCLAKTPSPRLTPYTYP